ncbi:MAG: hypothetical protein SVY53_03845 [Chloroflexota bacterium]|nr:hypothetical protein [Chloroflexota bacterium]
MNTKNYYAHTLPDDIDPAHCHLLEDHLYGVAERAAEFVRVSVRKSAKGKVVA